VQWALVPFFSPGVRVRGEGLGVVAEGRGGSSKPQDALLCSALGDSFRWVGRGGRAVVVSTTVFSHEFRVLSGS